MSTAIKNNLNCKVEEISMEQPDLYDKNVLNGIIFAVFLCMKFFLGSEYLTFKTERSISRLIKESSTARSIYQTLYVA
jgi:hypothetical protein